MKLRIAAIILLAGTFVAGTLLVGRSKIPVERILPAEETHVTVALNEREAAVQKPSEIFIEDVNPDWTSAIDSAATRGSDTELDSLFGEENLPATAKAHLIDAALLRQDSRLLSKAEDLLRKMIASGTVADVLAAIPKISYFADATAKEIASMQESLCRFQAESEDEFGFEMIKVKFNLVLGRDPSVKPWPAVCGAI